MPEIQGIGSKTNPYEVKKYTMKPTEKNTITIESYFKLLGAQLANQDMMNPMDNSEMLNQMTQMAMVQSIASMTEGLKETQALSRQTHAMGMLGKKVSTQITGSDGEPKIITGKVERVELGTDTPSIRISGYEGVIKLQDVLNVGIIEKENNNIEKNNSNNEKNSVGKEV